MPLLALLSCGAPPPPRPAPPVVIARPIADKPLVVAPLPATTPERLPHTFEPTRYAAHLQVDPALPAFTATVEIAGELAEPSALIWINAEGLTITGVTASRADASVRMATKYATKPGWLALQSEQPLAAGPWTLTITYTGTWNDKHAVGGFVERDKRTAQSAAGADRYVYTQFEPDYARRVFPCFDEPDRKVPWQLTLDVPEALVAASNTPIESETHVAALEWTATHSRRSATTVRFAQTPPLPSYLIAFAVGPFDVVDAGHSNSGIPIRLLTLRGKGPEVAAAARSIPALLDKIESWLGVPFPYAKLDVVEVQVTAEWWGAMENAGLITFNTDMFDSRAWDGTILHELAHHWFGDYVTPAWWDDIWLNESFAYWIAV
ncbi:MAG TPA: M1 family aminopeptidase, partial [Kofleriaceae bacterium]